MPPKNSNVIATGKNTGMKRGPQDDASDYRAKAQCSDNINGQLRQSMSEEKASATIKKHVFPDNKLGTMFGADKVTIYDDYSCTLNQTNICQNSNKFYLIQLATVLRDINPYITYTRWGRVGEEGRYKYEEFSDIDQAKNSFRSNFKSKTGNDWDSRFSFKPIHKKYTFIDIDDEPACPRNSIVPKSKLDYRTQIMIDQIFSIEMFHNVLLRLQLDINKNALGKLSKLQIAKGLECLLEIENALPYAEDQLLDIPKLTVLSSKFYTIIPHDFGRQPPKIFFTQMDVDKKRENMMTLIDLEIAQSLQDKKMIGEINQTDANYENLKCDLEWIPVTDENYKMIEKYIFAACGQIGGASSYPNIKICDIWKVKREGETERMSLHKDLHHRKLLWLGKDIATIAAILKDGLRIMPFSGGRLGRGLYFASEFARSLVFVHPFPGFINETDDVFMLLVEVALGSTKEITDNSCNMATAAPKGYDSIVGRGKTEPDELDNLIKKFDGHNVIVPYGVPKEVDEFKFSSYWTSDYVVYKESQAQLRYLVKLSNA